jgi:dephospho-CoA kinase
LTGGIGSGKSEAGKIFAGLGALLVDADAIAREVLAPGTQGLALVRERWPQAFLPDGSLNREALAAIVFDDRSERAALNAIVHPRVRARASEIEAQAAPDQAVVHEIPLLFETGQGGSFDRTILVTAPRDVRIARVMSRSGAAREDVERRMAAQIPPREAEKLASFVIRNEGSIEDLRREVERVYRALVTIHR